MAEPGSNVIEYSFEGNTLDLQKAVKKVSSMLTSTVKELKALQGGELTKEQKAQVKNVRGLLKVMRAAAKDESSLTADQRKKTLTAGKAALAQTKQLSKEVTKVKARQAKEEEKEAEKRAKKQQEVEQLVSIAGQESARQRATYLEEYADKFKQILSADAYDDIKAAVAEYRAAVEDSSISEEELAEVTQRLQDAYKGYSQTLQAVNRSQQQASKGILSVGDFFKEGKRQALATIKSFSFWLQVIHKVAQAAKEYLNLLESLRRNGQLNNPKLKGIKETADSWRQLSRQVSLFMTNVGGLVTKVLAPAAKVLSVIFMAINAVLGAISDVNTLAENSYAGAGLTNLDEINTQQESEEDSLKKINRGWEDIKKTMQPVVDLATTFGEVIKTLQIPIQLVFTLLQTLWQFLSPIFGGVVEGLNLIVTAIMWVVNWVRVAINWVMQLLGAFGGLAGEGTVLHEVLRWIGIAISGLVAIALTKWIVAAAKSFATLAVNIAKASAKLVIYIAKQAIAIAKTIKSTIANWWENASLVAKIGLMTLGAGLVLVPVVLAAAGVFSAKASSDVPKLATGGVATGPTLAMIGEGKYNEAVVPLGNSPQFASMKESIAESVAGKVAGNRGPSTMAANRPIVLNLNGKEVARALMPELGFTQMQTGVRLK